MPVQEQDVNPRLGRQSKHRDAHSPTCSAIPETKGIPLKHLAVVQLLLLCVDGQTTTSTSILSRSGAGCAAPCCGITMAPTSLIRASCSQTELLTLIPSSSRPLHGKVIQLSPGSQRGLKNKEGGKKKCPRTTKIRTPEDNFLLWIFKTSGWRITFSFLCCLSSQ